MRIAHAIDTFTQTQSAKTKVSSKVDAMIAKSFLKPNNPSSL